MEKRQLVYAFPKSEDNPKNICRYLKERFNSLSYGSDNLDTNNFVVGGDEIEVEDYDDAVRIYITQKRHWRMSRGLVKILRDPDLKSVKESSRNVELARELTAEQLAYY